jgi:hypothetical protein
MNAEANQVIRIDNDIINSREVTNYTYRNGKLTLRAKGKTCVAYHEEAYEIKEKLDNEFRFREYLTSIPF